MPDPVIAEMQGRAYIGQQRAQAFLALRNRHRGGRFAIEMEQIEQEKDERLAVAGVRCVPDQAERGGAIGANAAQFAVKIGCRAGSFATTAAVAGYLGVQSSPVRVSNRPAPQSSRACIR